MKRDHLGERQMETDPYDGPPSPSMLESTASESRRTGRSISVTRLTEMQRTVFRLP